MSEDQSSPLRAISSDTWPGKSSVSKAQSVQDLSRISRTGNAVLAIALVAALIVGLNAGALGAILLWVVASAAAWLVMVFLLGIPKTGLTSKSDVNGTGSAAGKTPNSVGGRSSQTANDAASRARPNTNLEEVSDWLTKIIVGLTLVNFDKIKEEVQRICLNAAASFHAKPSAADVSAATALVVGFALLGFLGMYLYMRLYVQGAIAHSDNKLAYLQAVEAAQRITDSDPAPAREVAADGAMAQPVVPSPASLNAAQMVADVAPADQELLLQPLRQLAAEYEALRGQQGYSPQRTRQMADIVHRMRPHAIAAAPYISQLMNSASTGDHLAATVILQMKFMPEHTPWLVRRLVEERAFIGYQAASALLARVKVAGVPECSRIKEAVGVAKADRDSHGMAEPSLDRLIDQILSTT